MADSTKGTEEKGLGEEEQSIAVVVADEDGEYSSPSDPCPSPSPKRRKKGDGEEGNKDYIPPIKGETAPRRSKRQPKKKDPSKDDEVPANTTGSKKSERSAKAKKRKGERSVNRKDEGFHVVTHVSPKGEPLTPKTALREKIPITVKDWDHVSNGDKKVLWKELKKIFQFPDGSEPAVRNCALQTMAKSWRGWKTTLNKKFVKTGCIPFSTYANITPNQWEDFLTLKNSPKEIQRSQKYSELAKKNKFPHRLGSAGYAPKVEQWTKEEEEMRKAGLPVPMKEWTQRSRNWVRARTPKITDEGKVSFQDPELQGVADKIENLSSSQKKGFFKPKREKDVLSTVLGTPEHGGRVREPEPDYPFDDLKENTPCRLHVPIGRSGKTLEAATAIAIPRRTYNEEFIPDAYAKVQPQVVHEGFESYDIDFPTADGVSVLGDAVDLVILWHKNDISFGLGTDATRKPEVPKPGLGKPPKPPKKKVIEKAEEPEMHKENIVPEVAPKIEVPEVPMEIALPDVQMEIKVAEPEVQFVASVGTEIEEVPGLEWDGTDLEIFEDPSPAKDPEVQETTVPEKATTSSEVPRVLRSHDSKSKDKNKEKFMVTVFRGGKERAKLRDDDPQKAAELAGPTYFATDDCPEKYEHGKALLPEWALKKGPWEMRRLHTFYMEASKKGLGNSSIIGRLFRRTRMQYMDAKKKKEPIGFLDPTRICQTQHTERLAPGSDQLKGKNPKQIAEYKKGLHKEN
uniref:Hydroxyproline-rich glycoprotein-like n=1 Tax=Oryza sativa subsp. japonica TaxID=39947 RepID=Q6Z9M4_ORYSJ|nr:hydroxyproline-rich glycoprotein-like [Oryza sativa Japonica Group]